MITWFVEMLIATTLLMALVLLVRRPVAQHFGPRVAYALWLIPALRLILPPLPKGWIALQGDVMQQVTQSLPLVPASTQMPLIDITLLWTVGACAFFAWHALAYARFSRRMRNSATRLFEQDAIEIGQTALIQSPLAFGVIEKAVMLPADFAERYDDQEQHFAIGHELMHHRRGDLIANMAALGMLSLQWFNPVAHIAFKAFRADQEAACDASVLASASDDERHAYGSALVKSALGQAPLVACRISGASRVKTRLSHILAARHTESHHEAGLTLAGVALVAGLGLTASGMIEPSAPRAEQLRPALASQMHMRSLPNTRPQEIAVASQNAQTPILVAKNLAPQHPVLASLAKSETKTALTQPVRAAPVVPNAEPAPIMTSLSPKSVDTPKQVVPTLVSLQQCETSGGTVLRSEAVLVRDGEPRSFAVAVCAPASFDQENRRAVLIKGLTAARTKILDDPRVPDEERADVIAMIDMQIGEISGEGTTLL